jgi:hypothetical protein
VSIKTRNTSPTIQTVIQNGGVSFDFLERKLILKWHQTFEKVCDVQRLPRGIVETETPTGLEISRILDILLPREAAKRVQAKNWVNSPIKKRAKFRCVIQHFTRPSNGSVGQCATEIEIRRKSVHHILKTAKWNYYVSSLLHATVQVYLGGRVELRELLVVLKPTANSVANSHRFSNC